jgi:hypothetical protein
MLLLATILFAQASPRPRPLPAQPRQQENVRCLRDSFGNYTCTDGTRIIHDSFGNVTIIPPRR